MMTEVGWGTTIVGLLVIVTKYLLSVRAEPPK